MKTLNTIYPTCIFFYILLRVYLRNKKILYYLMLLLYILLFIVY